MFKAIDCHAHIFPPLWEASGFDSPETHALYQQHALNGKRPVRRRRDHAYVDPQEWWDPTDPTPTGRLDLNFRAGPHGRLEWERDGEGYYVQFLPPNLHDSASRPEVLVAQMDYVGVETAILQNDPIYGRLSPFFADAMARFPGRFIGLAQIEESFAYTDEQIASLTDQVERLGMKGLYFRLTGFFRNGYKTYYDDPAFDPFWEAMRRLRVPLFIVFHVRPFALGEFAEEIAHFLHWLERHPDIPTLVTHGWPTAQFADADDRVTFPDGVAAAMAHPGVFTELLYPIAWGGDMDYPFDRARHHVRQTYDRFGPDRLVWGSDMPNVERFCTYRQSLSYVRDHCPFLSDSDKEKIFRTNALAVFEAAAR